MNEQTNHPPADVESPAVAEPEFHASIRMHEIEPILGKKGKWAYLGWVTIWVVLLTIVLVIYVVASRF